MFYLACICALLASYLIGSVPTGYWIVKRKKGIDLRNVGSGSTGATNVSRVLGKKWFFIVMLLDILKGFLPVFVAIRYFGNTVVVFTALGLVVGHSRSCFLKGKGGKSVATGMGTLIALDWVSGLVVFLIWALIVQTSEYVSKASMYAFIVAPFVLYLFSAPMVFILYSIVSMVYIIYRHKDNIKRLHNHTEEKIRME